MNEMKLSNMGNIFIEIFDIKVLYAIHLIVYIYQGNTVKKTIFCLKIVIKTVNLLKLLKPVNIL